MKKTITIFIFAFLLTGCTANYNLEINDTIKEELRIPINKNKDEILNKVNNLSPVIDDFDSLYKYNIINNNNEVIVEFEYKNNYIDNIISNQCFENYYFNENDEYINITASGKFGCLYDADNININIKTDYYVQQNNSNQINDNKYTWVINSNNKNNVDLSILINKKLIVEEEKTVFVPFVKILLIISLISIIFYLYKLYCKNKESKNDY